MREIKFRAWNKEKKEWIDLEDCKLVLWSDGSGYIILHEGMNCGDEDITISLDKCVLVQFTGLKDKNGKEIYEGDIMQVTSKFLPPQVVTFKYGMFFLKNDSLYHYADNEEIIGNIYENPELLDVEK